MNWEFVLPAFGVIISQAFAPKAQIAGAAGGSILIFLNTMVWGVKRGLFSNEAGQGSAPIAHAAAKTKEPVREGVVAGRQVAVGNEYGLSEPHDCVVDELEPRVIVKEKVLREDRGIPWIVREGSRVVPGPVVLYTDQEA